MTDLAGRALGGLEAAVCLVEAGGRVALANRAARDLFGREMTGADLASRALDDGPPLLASLVEAVRPALGEGRLERLLVCSEGPSPRFIWVTLVPLARDARRRPASVLMAQDVTAALAGAPALQKILSQVRHDLRSPLTSVAGSAELLLSGRVGELQGTQRRLVTIIEDSARKIGAILDRTAARPASAVQKASGEGDE